MNPVRVEPGRPLSCWERRLYVRAEIISEPRRRSGVQRGTVLLQETKSRIDTRHL